MMETLAFMAASLRNKADSMATPCSVNALGRARNLAVIVGLDDQDPDLLIVTVMTRTR